MALLAGGGIGISSSPIDDPPDPSASSSENLALPLWGPSNAAPDISAGLRQTLAEVLEQVQSLRQPLTHVPMSAWITHYGERFNDRLLGCFNYGDYASEDPTIVAVNPTLYEELPCGTLLELCGPGGCMIAARKDSCPGCRPDGFDLSEAGFARVCGDADGVCTASVKVLTICQVRKFGKPPEEAAWLEAEEARETGRIPCHPARVDPE